MSKKKEHYSRLKLVLRVGTLVMSTLALALSVWALVIAYQAKDVSEWVDKKQDNIIEQVLFQNDDIIPKN